MVIAVINESSSSRFSLSFLTSDSIARLEKPSLSPPCLWHINEWTMLKHASAEVGAVVFMAERSKNKLIAVKYFDCIKIYDVKEAFVTSFIYFLFVQQQSLGRSKK